VGFPPPPNLSNYPVTNVRNTKSPYWRGWLKPEFRCLIPFTSFCEYEDTKPKKMPTWFALSEERPLAAFAGIWRPWAGTRGTKAAPVEGEHLVFSFLTTDANAEVGAIHPKAMPAILTKADEVETWLSAAPMDEELSLQRPLPDGALQIVTRGEKEDPARGIMGGVLRFKRPRPNNPRRFHSEAHASHRVGSLGRPAP
jgi:putative SOS response-associated peptidase YedK